MKTNKCYQITCQNRVLSNVAILRWCKYPNGGLQESRYTIP